MSACPDHLPSTPDGRYFVHRGILWRCSNPALDDDERQKLVRDLMRARRDVGTAKRAGDEDGEKDARRRVHAAKVGLGERGPLWWGGDEDHNRMKPENTPYAEWWASVQTRDAAGPSPEASGDEG